MLTTLRTWISRIDERPVAEIDRDIDEELAGHMAELRAELTASGLSCEQAEREAISRFGNPVIHARRCRDVALLERRMKTTIQITVTILCALLLGTMAIAEWVNNQQTTHALDVMATRLDGLSKALDARGAAPAGGVIAPAVDESVYITGAPVGRAGVYTVPSGGISLRRLLAASETNLKFVQRVDVRRREGSKPLPVAGLSIAALNDPQGPDIMLEAGDLVTVSESKP